MYSNIDMTYLGRIAREKRWALGYTQQKVADEIGIDIRAITQFETGKTKSFRVMSWYWINDCIDNSDIRRACHAYKIHHGAINSGFASQTD